MRALIIWLSLLPGVAAASCLPSSKNSSSRDGPITSLHYAPNNNFDGAGNYAPGVAGFNLADVGNLAQLNKLPDSVSGLIWVGMCSGVDAQFLAKLRPFVRHPKVFGFYLVDEPDRTGLFHPLCTADHLTEESDWIHANIPGAKTFIVLMPLSSKASYDFTYNPANSHIDLFGIDVYPCRTELPTCKFDSIAPFVAAARDYGIPLTSIVPVYQAFGGGEFKDDAGGKYRRPTPSEMRELLATWGALVPAPPFDFAYSWGVQSHDEALEASKDLQEVLLAHNERCPTP